jgi:quinol monooxygenase YgiN
MKRIMVRYKVKSDKAAENEAYIKKVFEELKQAGPEGFRYAAFKQDDGLSFVHIVSFESEGGSNPLADSPAFKAFQAEIGARCEEPPVAVELSGVGSYRFFGS